LRVLQAAVGTSECSPGNVIEYRPKVMMPAFDPIMSGNDARDWLYSMQDPYMVTIELPALP
jgi:hypothetical protein